MKIWYPVSFEESQAKTLQQYVYQCVVDLALFKTMLSRNIPQTKLKSMTARIIKSTDITSKDTTFSVQKVLNRYLSSLQCKYDAGCGRCCYYISDLMKCPDSDKSLNYVVRLLEYGNDKIPPMFWIRRTYRSFSDYVVRKLDNEREVL